MSVYRRNFQQIFAEHQPGPFNIENRNFIESIASALYERLADMPSPEDWPQPVLDFYTLYDLNFQVGNGGFAQAAYNAPDLFPDAIDAFRRLNLPQAAVLCEQALKKLPAELQLFFEKGILETDSLDDVFEHFNDSELNELDDQIPDEFWADAELQKLAEDNEDAFLAVDELMKNQCNG